MDERLTEVRAVVSVDYDEFKPWTFRGVAVRIGEEKHRFKSLDEAYEFAFAHADTVLNASSVDDYRHDSATISLN